MLVGQDGNRNRDDGRRRYTCACRQDGDRNCGRSRQVELLHRQARCHGPIFTVPCSCSCSTVPHDARAERATEPQQQRNVCERHEQHEHGRYDVRALETTRYHQAQHGNARGDELLQHAAKLASRARRRHVVAHHTYALARGGEVRPCAAKERDRDDEDDPREDLSSARVRLAIAVRRAAALTAIPAVRAT